MIRHAGAIAVIAFVSGLSQAGQERPAPKSADIVKQLQRDFDEARSGLHRNDPGAKTRAAHRRIIEGLDELLKQEDDAPSPPASPPKNSASKENQQPKNNRPMPESGPAPKVMPVPEPKSRPDVDPAPQGKGSESSKADPDGPWDTRPNLQRQAVDAAGRERFPRHYAELLRAYYRSIAVGRGEEP